MIDIRLDEKLDRLTYEEVLELAKENEVESIIFRKISNLRMAILGAKDSKADKMEVHIVGEYKWDGRPKIYRMRKMDKEEMEGSKYRVYTAI